MDVKVKFNSCGINADTLDDWLESDLRQSGILPSDNKDEKIKCEPYDFSMLVNNNKWERQSSVDGSDDNTTVVNDSDFITKGGDTNNKNSNSDDKNNNKNNNNLLLPADITPFLKALAILTSLHQQQGQSPIIYDKANTNSNITISPLSTILPSVINPLEITKKSPTITRLSSTKPIIPNLIAKAPINNNYTSNIINTNNIKKRVREEEGKEDISTSVNQNETMLDPIILKRQKNTDAARRSRLRKVVKMESLEKRVTELEKNNNQLRLQVIISETERDNAQLKEAQQRERVERLEKQLAEAHRSLLMKDQQQNCEDENDKIDNADHQKDNNDKEKEDTEDNLKEIKKEVIEN